MALFKVIEKPGSDKPRIIHVYGLSGSGKSYYVNERTKSLKRAIIDLESGFRYLLNAGDKYFVTTKASEVLAAFKEAAKDDSVNCIILDGCTTLWILQQAEKARTNDKGTKAVDIGQWGVMKAEIEQALLSLLASEKDVYLIQRAVFEEKSKTVEPQGTDVFQYYSDVSVYISKSGKSHNSEVVKIRKKNNTVQDKKEEQS